MSLRTPALSLHHYGNSLVQDRPHQKHGTHRPGGTPALHRQKRRSQVRRTIYLWTSTQLALQMKSGAIKQLAVQRQKLWSQWPLGAAEREKAVCRSEAWTGREAQRRISDGQRHKAVVLLDVSLEDI